MTPLRKESSRYEATKHEGIFRDKRSGIFYFRDTVHKDENSSAWIDRSLKTKQITIALDRANQIKNKIVRGEEQSGSLRTFDEAFDLVIKIQTPKAAKTLEQTQGAIKHLRPWFKNHCNLLSTFERGFEEKWAEYDLYQKQVTPNRKLEHDRRYLLMALKRGKIKGWIKREFKKKDFVLNESSESIGKYIEPDDVKRLLQAAQPYPKLRLQILIALSMGMRISEILHLSRDEIDLKKREIDLNPKRIKTRRRREVPIPIPEDLYPLIRERFEGAKGAYLFPAEFRSIEGGASDPNQPQDDNSYHWNKVREVTGIDARFHDLRHTAITNMIKAGLPETAVRKFCGVSETTMRRIYAHIETELKARFRNLFRGIYVE